MTNFIFRWPFVTEKRKLKANNWLMIAKMYQVLAEAELQFKGGVITKDYVRYLSRSANAMREASWCLGFVSTEDLAKYIEVNGVL